MDPSVYWYGGQSPRVEPLRGVVRSEVVVVGGGVAGLTCAQTLAARGTEVTLVERAFCGAEASGRSSGFITPDSELELSDLLALFPCILPGPARASSGRRPSESTWPRIVHGRAELDEVLSPVRHFAVGRRLQRLLGKPSSFASSHAMAKYLRK